MMRVTGLVLASLTAASLPAAASADTGPAADTLRGTVEVVGKGEASAPPEFTELTIVVTSLCYDTSVGAKNATAELATKLVTLLQGYQSGPSDTLTAVPGASVRQSETYFGDDGKYHTLCTLKWRTSEQITLRMKNLDGLSELQDRVLAAVDQQSSVTPSQTAQSYAELGQPVFGLTDATMNKLTAEAQTKAQDDANRQFHTFVQRCNFQDPQLIGIKPPTYVIVPSYGNQAAQQAGSQSLPVIPDQVAVSATWDFTWSYIPTGPCRS